MKHGTITYSADVCAVVRDGKVTCTTDCAGLTCQIPVVRIPGRETYKGPVPEKLFRIGYALGIIKLEDGGNPPWQVFYD